ncbi:hypothetical protein PR202_gb25168 [Eleusine coracana subsp. coracana]|uniref:DUF6598 domain-containing protein n=1 Tax=Eleusine coracana subsp. coracana TaxID=191504 RepID=A0AAV5FNA2_ELECO|nr:hypothetical protein PR202_gb25168 [Eleusine coracana subsp. coracana]
MKKRSVQALNPSSTTGQRCWPSTRRRRRQRKKEERKMKRLARGKAVEDRIRDFDPKQGGEYFNRFCYTDLSKFDLDKECERPYELCEALNILSVKIASSDVGFPISVYGTVIARDSIDKKCVYLFRRDRDHCQRINSEDQSLILTGPKRGLALIDDAYVEIDLKIKSQGEQDKELSKGFVEIEGIARRWLDKCIIESECLGTRLSTAEVTYGVVKDAVEATFAIEVLQGYYYGQITAWTTSIQNTLVLHDSKVAGARAGDGNRAIQLSRPVVAVYVKEKLYVKIAAQTHGKIKHRTVVFIPKVNGEDKREVYVGATQILVKVTWSIIDF